MSSPENLPEEDTWPAARTGSKRRNIPVLIVAGCADSLGAGRKVLRLGNELTIGRTLDAADARCWTIRDHLVSGLHARIERGSEGFDLVDVGSRNGTIVGWRRIKNKRVPLWQDTLMLFGGHAAHFGFVGEDDLVLLEEERKHPLGPVATVSVLTARMGHGLRALAHAPEDLLFIGETGVGKEVYARAAHGRSGRRGAFVALNCAALQPHLVESELFGFKRGAHSQAMTEKSGIVSEADGGTLLLDEIGDMPPELQGKILRLVQTREYVPLGGTRPVRLDARIMAATLHQGKLRPDLLHRFGDPILIPQLHRRREDIPALAEHFLRESAVRRIETDAFQMLMLYAWPGNIRELEKTMVRASRLAEADQVEAIGPEHLPESLVRSVVGNRSPLEPQAIPPPGTSDMPSRQARVPKEALERLLEKHRGNVSAVARETGRRRTLVWKWIRQDGTSLDKYRL